MPVKGIAVLLSVNSTPDIAVRVLTSKANRQLLGTSRASWWEHALWPPQGISHWTIEGSASITVIKRNIQTIR